jgi:hypothetical protein
MDLADVTPIRGVVRTERRTTCVESASNQILRRTKSLIPLQSMPIPKAWQTRDGPDANFRISLVFRRVAIDSIPSTGSTARINTALGTPSLSVTTLKQYLACIG